MTKVNTRAGVQSDQQPGGWAKPRLVYVSGSQPFGLLHISHSENFLQKCKIHNKSSFIRALNRLFRLALQYILRWLISLRMNYRRQNEIFGIGIYFQPFIYISTVIHLILVVVVKLNFYCWIKSLTHVWELPICPFIFQVDFLNSIPPIFW